MIESVGHEELPAWTEADLLAWHDHHIETAKEILTEQRELVPMVFILTLPEHIEDGFKKQLVPLDALTRAGDSGREDWTGARYITAVLPLSSHPDALWEYIRESLIPPEHRDDFDEPLEMGRRLGIPREEVKPRALAVLRKALGYHEKDIFAAYIKHCLRRTRALAFIKMDDAFYRVAESRTEAPPDLSAIPTSPECIMASMETQAFARVVTVPYERETPRTGKVTRFLEPQVLRASRYGGDGQQLSGRFMWMLPAPM